MSHENEALTNIGKRLDAIDGKLDKLTDELKELAIARATSLAQFEVALKEIAFLKREAIDFRRFETQGKAVVAVLGVAWTGLLAILELTKRK